MLTLRRPSSALLLFLAALALALYLFQLGAAPLWYDEAGTAWMSALPIPRLLAATAGDTHPPLYLLLEAGMQAVAGNTPWALRLPSVTLALAALGLTALIADALGLAPRARWLSLGLLVLSPFQLHFAQEARMYALFQCEILLAVYALLTRRFLLLSLALLAALYTHNYAVVYWPVLALMSLSREMDQPFVFPGKWSETGTRLDLLFLALCLPVLAWLPWLVILRGQMQMVAGGYWIPLVNAGNVLETFYQLWWAFGLAEYLKPIAVLVTAGLGLWLTRRAWGGAPGRALWWLALAPLGIAIVLSIVWKPILLFRGLAPSVPLLFLLLGWALDQLSLSRRLYVLLLLVPLLVASVIGHYLWNPDHKTGTQPYAAVIREQWQAGDVILHSNEGSLMELHSATADLSQFILPRCATPNIGGLSAATRAAMGMQEANLAAPTWARAWFVNVWGPTITDCEHERALAFLAEYPHTLVSTIRNDAYVEADLWLITR